MPDPGWVQVGQWTVGIAITFGVSAGGFWVRNQIQQVRIESLLGRAESSEHVQRCEEERKETTREFITVCKDYARSNEQFVAALRAIEKSIERIER